MRSPPGATHEAQSSDGSHVKLTWFEDGGSAVVQIIRPGKKSGAAFSMSRAEATALRTFLPADRPDEFMPTTRNDIVYNLCGQQASGTLSKEQKRLARHALGLPNEKGQSYRNRYIAPMIGDATVEWHAMKDAGYAKIMSGAKGVSTGPMFYLTETGARLALNEGESLDPEDFPC